MTFVQYLNDDHQQKSREWENKTLDQFLSGLSGCTNDRRGFCKNMGETVDVETITWRMAAQMLLAATVYGSLLDLKEKTRPHPLAAEDWGSINKGPLTQLFVHS